MIHCIIFFLFCQGHIAAQGLDGMHKKETEPYDPVSVGVWDQLPFSSLRRTVASFLSKVLA